MSLAATIWGRIECGGGLLLTALMRERERERERQRENDGGSLKIKIDIFNYRKTG